MPEIIYSIPYASRNCPICRGKLRVGKPMVMQMEGERKKMNSILPVSCERCRLSFANDTTVRRFQEENRGVKPRMLRLSPGMTAADIRMAMHRPPNRGTVCIDTLPRTKRVPGRTVRPSDYRSTVLELEVSFDGGPQETCLILSERERIPPEDAGSVFYYGTADGLELLTGEFVRSRGRTGILQKSNYIIRKRILSEQGGGVFRTRCAPKTLYLRSNGGYYQGKDKRYQIVDLLLYTRRTDRLQILKSTFDSRGSFYYTDARLFREFVLQHGMPEVQTTFSLSNSQSKGRISFDEMAEESILKQFGYSVGKNGMSRENRRRLLADLVDMKILTVSKIIFLLNFFLSSHTGSQYYNACNDWQSDIEFISTYRTNPSRFLIPAPETVLKRGSGN